MAHKGTSHRGARRLCTGSIGLLACSGALAAALVGVSSAPAEGAAHRSAIGPASTSAAKVENVNEVLSLRVTKIEGDRIFSQGQPLHGQIKGVASFAITLENGAKARAVFTIVDNDDGGDGSVHGVGIGKYYASGTTTYFSGSKLTINGTGKFAHAKLLVASIVGTLNRRTYRISATLKGKFIR